MEASRIRVEIIRFSLLITITIAAISVAVRHGDHHDSTQAARSGHPPASASAGGTPSGATSGGKSGGGSAAGNSSGGQGAGNQGAGNQGTGSPGTGNQSTGNQSTGTGSSGAQTVQMLPRTGAAQVAELGGLAALLIVAGSLSMSVSRRSSR